MKRMIRILVLAVALVTGLTTVTAQQVQVLITKKVPTLPSTVTSYLDDPLRYFNVQFVAIGAGNEGIDIFFDLNFTLVGSDLYLRTRQNTIPLNPIRLSEGANLMKAEKLGTQLDNRLETNVDYSNPLGVLQLPEGTYQLCVDIYLWSERFNPDRVSITIPPCPEFELCYSGSAPELVSPMAGAQMALNGAMVVSPNRKVNFFWTPVISNCAGNNTRFKYKLKVVKVFQGQNFQDAIKFNPTVFSAEVKNNYAVFDTLRDIKVHMEKGALYVAQVQAEAINNSRAGETFLIANDGNSQPLPFFWDVPDELALRSYSYSVDDESEEGDDDTDGVVGVTQWEGGVEEASELETIIEEMKVQYLAGFIQDADAIATLTAAYPKERQYVPVPQRRYVESDGYYTVPMTDDLEVSFMPARHEALKNVTYSIDLYDYMDGGVEEITANEPLLSAAFEEVPESYSKMDSHELVSRTLAGWGSDLTQGNLYYMQLSSYYTVGYWKYNISDTIYYVNEQMAEHIHDTISREFVEEQYSSSNGVFFQWGDDPEAPGFTTPQWRAPVDRSDDDIYDPVNAQLPATVSEVKKAKTFPISWTPVKGVAEGDEVVYEVNVYELKPKQTLEEAVSENKVLVSRTVTDANEISQEDKDFFKVFSVNKMYLMTLSTSVNSEENSYHFENGNEALPIIFKIVK